MHSNSTRLLSAAIADRGHGIRGHGINRGHGIKRGHGINRGHGIR